MPARAKSWASCPVRSWPSTSTRPALGATRPEATRASVVLPTPLGPMSGHRLGRGDRERDAEQGAELVVAGVDVVELEHRDAVAGPGSTTGGGVGRSLIPPPGRPVRTAGSASTSPVGALGDEPAAVEHVGARRQPLDERARRARTAGWPPRARPAPARAPRPWPWSRGRRGPTTARRGTAGGARTPGRGPARPADRGPAAGTGPGASASAVQAHQLEHGVGPGLLLGGGLGSPGEVPQQAASTALGPVGHQQVLAHGQPAEQLDALEGAGDAQPGPAERRHAPQVVAVEADLAAVGVDDAGQAVEQGGLARAVGADQPHQLAGRPPRARRRPGRRCR